MLEVNRILFVLVLEGLALFAASTLWLSMLAILRRKRRARAIGQLAEQIRHQSSLRREQTGAYLKAIYQLEDDELHDAVNAIDRQEKLFFQHLIDVIYHEDDEQIAVLDAALAELIDTYKNLRPRELVRVEAGPELLAENEELRQSNEKLRDELTITRETMSSMLAEFGNMFGGGADHELARHEVVEKLRDQYGLDETDDTTGATRDGQDAAAADGPDAGSPSAPPADKISAA